MKKQTIITLLAIILTMCFLLSSCQPTPEKQVVQSKNNEKVKEAIEQTKKNQNKDPAATPVIYTFKAPEKWIDEAHKEEHNVDIIIDADVVVLTDTWSIYELIPRNITKDDMKMILDALVGNKEIISLQNIPSRERLEENILRYKRQKADFQKLYNERVEKNIPDPTPNPNGLHSWRDMSKKDLLNNIEISENKIKDFERQLPIAKDVEYNIESSFNIDTMFSDISKLSADELAKSGIQYETPGFKSTQYVKGICDLGKITPAEISFSHSKNNFRLYFTNLGCDEQGFSSGVKYTEEDLFCCEISMEDAAIIAREKVYELGYGYLDIESVNTCEYLDRKKMKGDKLPQCFEFVFTRKLDGATVTNAFADGAQQDNTEQYAPYWPNVEVAIKINDSGVVGVNIHSTKSDVVQQADGIKLMNIGDIIDILKMQIFIKNAYYNGNIKDEKIIKRELHVDEIRLGYMPTVWKNHLGKQIFIPVWDFFGEEITTYIDDIKGDLGESLDENNQKRRDLRNESLLTINALDGTIMNRR